MDLNISIKDTSSVQIEEVENQKSGISDAGASLFTDSNSINETSGDLDDMDAGSPSEELLAEIESAESQKTESDFENEVQKEDLQDSALEITDGGEPPEFDF